MIHVLRMFYVIFFNSFGGPTPSHEISESARTIFINFSGLVELCKGLISWSSILRLLKGVATVTHFWAKFTNLAYIPSFVVLAL